MSLNSIRNDIKRYASVNYMKVTPDQFVMGDCPYNHRCHLNAVQKVKEGKAEKVFVCVADTGNDPVIHFINQLSDGKYQDNTWGWLYAQSNYYIIREVRPSEFDKIWDVLNDAKKSLTLLHTNWFQRKWHKIDVFNFI